MKFHSLFFVGLLLSTPVLAQQKIYMDALHPSHILIPVK